MNEIMTGEDFCVATCFAMHDNHVPKLLGIPWAQVGIGTSFIFSSGTRWHLILRVSPGAKHGSSRSSKAASVNFTSSPRTVVSSMGFSSWMISALASRGIDARMIETAAPESWIALTDIFSLEELMKEHGSLTSSRIRVSTEPSAIAQPTRALRSVC